jgi:hypothetical protein
MKTGLTNAAAEGINSIIQLTKSKSRGFRNVNNFISMIYMLGIILNFVIPLNKPKNLFS